MLLSEFIREGTRLLSSLYPEREASATVQRLCEDLLGLPHLAHVLHPETVVPPEREEELQNALGRLLRWEPLQYVTGMADFCGRRFAVRPGVLIPRPETEQLVQIVEETVPKGARVLDLCTGSGCIAWSIALDRLDSRVVAVDISEEALNIASSQPFEGPAPEFILADVLAKGFVSRFLPASFDFIVGNPPYVMEMEKAAMRSNVLDYEPELALFVKDDDPLVFYRAIACIAENLLSPGGGAAVEINESLGAATAEIYALKGFENVEIVKDFFGKDRFVKFRKGI